MATVDLIAQTVMNQAASLMNDTARVTYTYPAQVPYLNMALQELEEWFELHNIQSTEMVSPVIVMSPAGVTEINYNAVGLPSLPSDMIEPIQLWERQHLIDPFIPMTKREFLPHNLEGTPTNQFVYYTWQNNRINVLASNQINDIKIDYLRNLFAPVVDQSSQINCINAKTFLEYRTAALMAEFIERNKPSADALNAMAVFGLDRATGISSKGKQNIQTRRRPFRASYKRRGYVG